ncbi:MAG TPA: hypothetical protein V6C65_27240 [Allocoleopsis sp.]
MSYREQLNPWVVYRLLPNCQRVLLERFRKRNDAEEYLATMKRLAPGSTFEIMFEPNADLLTGDRGVNEAIQFSTNQPLSQSIAPYPDYRNLL